MSRNPNNKIILKNIALVVFLWSFSILQTSAIQVKVMLVNGQIEFVNVISANATGITWAHSGVSNPRHMPHQQIARIEFPEPGNWQIAESLYHKGEWEKAIAEFTTISNDGAANFYPAPGNYTSLARMRIIDCYREMGKYPEITKVVSTFRPESLPVFRRHGYRIAECWAELGKGNWDATLEKVNAVGLKGTDPGSGELGFIRGVIWERKANPKEAILAYASAYSLDFGSQPGTAKRALEASMRILESLGDENRRHELQAMVHTYARTFNKGKLHAAAPTSATELLGEKIDFFGGVEYKARKQTKKDSSKVVAINLRTQKYKFEGKEKGFEYTPNLKPIGRAPLGKDFLSEVTINGVTETGISMKISAFREGAKLGLALDKKNGLGTASRNQNDKNGAIDVAKDRIRFQVHGVKAFRVASVTFGTGKAHSLSKDDVVDFSTLRLEEGETGYPKGYKPKTAMTGDKVVVPFEGGFIKGGKDGYFFVLNRAGSFGIEAISVEFRK